MEEKTKAKQVKKNYLSRNICNYIDAFKAVRLDILFMTVYDLLFFLIVFNIGKELLLRLFGGMQTLAAIKPPQGIDMEIMRQNVAAIKQVYFSSIHEVIFAVLIAIFIYSIFKSLIWARVSKKNLTWNYLSGFFIVSVLWFAAWTLVCIASYFLFTADAQKAIYLIVTILLLHLTPLMNMYLAKTSRRWYSVKNAFWVGFARIYHFIIPYALSFATLAIIYVILGAVLKSLKIGPPAGTIILVISLLLYLSWHRIFLNIVVARMRK